MVDKAVLLNAGISELMDFHLQRIAKSGSVSLAFDDTSVLSEYERVDLEKGTRLVAQGLARWADAHHTSIRLTLRGAFALVNESFVKQARKLGNQSERINLPRAGSRRNF